MRILLRTLVAAAIVAALATPALANGRPPLSAKIVFRPGSTNEILVGTTFGFVISKDNGATWRWGCDSVVGIMGTYDPDYEMTSTGLILATSYGGLYLSRDGCTWTQPAGPLGRGTTSSVSVASNGWIYATLSDPTEGYKVYKSIDDGVSWTDISAGLPPSDWWNQIEVAPSDPLRLYLTGFKFNGTNPRARVLVRSLDGGQTWAALPVTAFVGTDNSDLLIAGIHPSRPDTVYIRVTLIAATLRESIYRSVNGGAVDPQVVSWAKVIEDGDNLPGFTIRGNGDVYVAHQMTQKLSRSISEGPFSVVPGVTYHAPCLAERRGDSTLFLCMKNTLDGEQVVTHLAKSTTGAAGAWTSVLRYADIQGPLMCAAGTLQHDDCELNLWCGTREQLGATSTEIDCTAPAVDAGTDGPGGGDPPPKSCCGIGGSAGIEAGSVLLFLFVPGLRKRRVVS